MAPPGKRLSLTSPARPRQSKNTSFQASGTKRYNNQSSPRRSLCSTNQFEALSEDDEDTPPDSEMLEQQEDLVRTTVESCNYNSPLALPTPTHDSTESTTTPCRGQPKPSEDDNMDTEVDSLDTSSLIEFPALPNLKDKTRGNDISIMNISTPCRVVFTSPNTSESIPSNPVDTSSLKPAFNPELHCATNAAQSPINSTARRSTTPIPDNSSATKNSTEPYTPRTSSTTRLNSNAAPKNPYLARQPLPTHSTPGTRPPMGLDQKIGLKRGATRHHVHRYYLRIKVKNTTTEDEE